MFAVGVRSARPGYTGHVPSPKVEPPAPFRRDNVSLSYTGCVPGHHANVGGTRLRFNPEDGPSAPARGEPISGYKGHVPGRKTTPIEDRQIAVAVSSPDSLIPGYQGYVPGRSENVFGKRYVDRAVDQVAKLDRANAPPTPEPGPSQQSTGRAGILGYSGHVPGIRAESHVIGVTPRRVVSARQQTHPTPGRESADAAPDEGAPAMVQSQDGMSDRSAKLPHERKTKSEGSRSTMVRSQSTPAMAPAYAQTDTTPRQARQISGYKGHVQGRRFTIGRNHVQELERLRSGQPVASWGPPPKKFEQPAWGYSGHKPGLAFNIGGQKPVHQRTSSAPGGRWVDPSPLSATESARVAPRSTRTAAPAGPDAPVAGQRVVPREFLRERSGLRMRPGDAMEEPDPSGSSASSRASSCASSRAGSEPPPATTRVPLGERRGTGTRPGEEMREPSLSSRSASSRASSRSRASSAVPEFP